MEFKNRAFISFGFVVVAILCLIIIAQNTYAQEFSLDKDSINISSVTGDFGFVSLKITSFNEGINITINTTTLGKKFLFFEESLTLLNNTTETFRISYFSPPTIEPRDYLLNMSFITPNLTKILEINLDIKDNIPPTIESCELDKITINRTLNAKVVCIGSDNYKLKSMTLILRENQTVFTFPLEKQTFILWSASFSVDKIGTYEATVDAVDTSGNSFNLTFQNLSVTQYIPITVEKSINFQSVKFDDWHRREIAQILAPVNISITLEKMNYTQSALKTIIEKNISLTWIDTQVEMPDGKTEFLHINETKEFKNIPEGYINLIIYGKNQAPFEGKLKIELLGHEFFIDIIGEIAVFTVPQKETWTLFGKEQECYGNYQGTLENSSLLCSLQFPITQCADTPSSECILASPKSLLINYEQLQSENAGLKSNINSKSILILILIVLIVLLFFGLFFYFIKQHWST